MSRKNCEKNKKIFFLKHLTRLDHVVEQTYEGYSEYNDYYIVNIDGELYEVEADDLNVGDKVTCYFVNEEEVVRTFYEWR